MKKIEAIVRPAKLEALKDAFLEAGIKGMTISQVQGCGNQHGWKEYYRGSEVIVNMLPKIMLTVVVEDDKVNSTVELICNTARTDNTNLKFFRDINGFCFFLDGICIKFSVTKICHFFSPFLSYK